MLHCSLLWTSCLRFLTKNPAVSQQLYKTASRSLSAIAELVYSPGTEELTSSRAKPPHRGPPIAPRGKERTPIKGHASSLWAVHDWPPDQQGLTPPNQPEFWLQSGDFEEVTGWVFVGNLYQQREDSVWRLSFSPLKGLANAWASLVLGPQFRTNESPWHPSTAHDIEAR